MSAAHHNQDILAAWVSQESHFAAPVVSPTKHEIGSSESSPIGPEISPAEAHPDAVSNSRQRVEARSARLFTRQEAGQRSVSLLFQEYYKMVGERREAKKVRQAYSEEATGLAKMFLLLCPRLPWLSSLSQLIYNLIAVWAMLAANLPFIVMPTWLWGVRQLYKQGDLRQAANLFGVGVVAFVIADQVYASLQKKRQDHKKGLTTKGYMPGGLPPVVVPKPALVPLAPEAAAQAPRTAGSPPSGSAGDAAEAAKLAELVPDLLALHNNILSTAPEPYHDEWNHEAFIREIQKLCHELNQSYDPQRPEMTADAIGQKLQQLKAYVGI